MRQTHCKNDSGPCCYQNIMPMDSFSCPSSRSLGFLSTTSKLYCQAQKINDYLGEPRTEAKSVLEYLRTTWSLYPLLPSVCILWERYVVATWVGASVPRPGLNTLLCKTKGLETEDLQGPFPCWRVGQGQVETCSILQKALSPTSAMTLLVSTLPLFPLFRSESCPDSSRTRDMAAGNFYTHSSSPVPSFSSLFFTSRVSSFLIPIFKAPT